MSAAMDDLRIDLAATLEPLDVTTRVAVIEAAVVAHGGSFVPHAPHGTWGPHFAEVDLLGLSLMGDTSAECIANWIKSAIRMAGERAAA